MCHRSIIPTAILLTALCGTAADGAPSFSPKAIYQKASKAVVMVLATDDGKDCSGGTGTIITPEGLVLTNSHVVMSEKTMQPYKMIRVYQKPERLTGDVRSDLSRPCKAELVARDENLDLALLRISGCAGSLPTVAMVDSSRVSVGEPVVAIGHPEQGGLWTLTTGSISTLSKNHGGVPGKDVFQTDADINRGNSGGPLLEAGARMVGVNTSMARRAEDGMTIVGINFALQSSVARGWLQKQGVSISFAPADKPSPVQQEKERGGTQSRTEPIKVIDRPSGAGEKQPVATTPRKVREKPVAPTVTKPARTEKEDEFSEDVFEKPGEWLMEGMPGHPYSLDALLKEVFSDVRSKAQKAFDELE